LTPLPSAGWLDDPVTPTEADAMMNLSNRFSFAKTALYWIAIAMLAFMVAPAAKAQTSYWDGTNASWNTASNWSTASGATTPNPLTPPDASVNAIFNITTVNANIAITLDADQAAQSLTFNNTGTTAIRGNTSGTTARSLTIGSGGITLNSGAGAVTFGGSVGVVNIVLSTDQTWTNNSANALNIGTGFISSATDANVALGAFNLTVTGSGNTSIGVSNQAESALTGSGTLTKTGTGVLQMGGANSGYTGNVFINGGVVNTGDATANGTGIGNISLNGGVLESRWSTGISRTQGTAANQIQIIGGISGLSGGGSGSGAATHNIGTITWGSATFNPTEFVLQSSNAGAGTTTLSSAINLNGADRTIRSDQSNIAGSGTFSGVISNSGPGTAGLIKTGVGQHILSATNTFNGNTTVNAGILTATITGALPGFATPGRVIVAGGATIGVRTGAWTAANIDSLRGAATWSTTSSRLGIDTTAGNFSYGSNITEALTVNKLGGNTLTLTGNNTYTGGTVLSAGTLSVGSATAIPSTGTISFNGGTIQSSDATLRTLSNTIALNADVTVGTTGNLTFSNTASTALGATRTFTIGGGNTTFAQAFTGSGLGITKAGAGTLTLTGANTFTGATTINAGTVVLNNDGDVTSSTVAFNGSNSGLTITGGSTVTSIWNNNGAAFGGSNGTISNNVQVLINGAGTAGSARLTNVTNLNWGAQLGGTGNTLTSSTLSLTNGGQMTVTGEVRTGSSYYGTGGGANISIGGGSATSTFTGNSGQAFYIGFGDRAGANNNVVTVSSNGVLTSIGNIFVGDLNYNGTPNGIATANKLTVSGTGTASMASITVGNARSAAASSAVNANVLEVISGGTLTTSGTNYIGRAYIAGSVANANTATVTGTGSTWNAGTSQNVFVGFTANATATSNNNILTVSSGGTVTGIAALTLGSGPGTETGNELVMLGGGSLTATTIAVSAGNTLRFGNGGATGSLNLTGNITNNGSMVFNLSDTITQGTHFDSAFGGTGSVTQNGSGTLVLNGANTFTGTTAVNAGTLSLAASGALPTGSAVTLNSGTLAVAPGTINGSTSGGVLTVSSDSVIDFGGTSSLTALSFGDSSGATWTGNLTINGYTGPGGNLPSSTTQLFIGGGNTLTAGQLAAITFTGYSLGAEQLPTGEVVPLGVIPEPGILLGLTTLGLLAACGLQRRR
jgi:autotransporter-associated beta strand protein